MIKKIKRLLITKLGTVSQREALYKQLVTESYPKYRHLWNPVSDLIWSKALWEERITIRKKLRLSLK